VQCSLRRAAANLTSERSFLELKAFEVSHRNSGSAYAGQQSARKTS
jgi:hypothetical protein